MVSMVGPVVVRLLGEVERLEVEQGLVQMGKGSVRGAVTLTESPIVCVQMDKVSTLVEMEHELVQIGGRSVGGTVTFAGHNVLGRMV